MALATITFPTTIFFFFRDKMPKKKKLYFTRYQKYINKKVKEIVGSIVSMVTS